RVVAGSQEEPLKFYFSLGRDGLSVLQETIFAGPLAGGMLSGGGTIGVLTPGVATDVVVALDFSAKQGMALLAPIGAPTPAPMTWTFTDRPNQPPRMETIRAIDVGFIGAQSTTDCN